MASRKILKGVVPNFLATYTNRYSDYGGYWVFGGVIKDMHVEKLPSLEINLMSEKSNQPLMDTSSDSIFFSIRMAVAKFKDQMQKVNLDMSCLKSAHLSITLSSPLKKGRTSNYDSSWDGTWRGYDVTWMVSVVSDLGRTFTAQKTIFVTIEWTGNKNAAPDFQYARTPDEMKAYHKTRTKEL